MEKAFSTKRMEGAHEEATVYAPGRESRYSEAALLEKEPISKVCDEVGRQPPVFYRWQKEFFENEAEAAAFESRKHGRTIPRSRNGSPTWRRRSK